MNVKLKPKDVKLEAEIIIVWPARSFRHSVGAIVSQGHSDIPGAVVCTVALITWSATKHACVAQKHADGS